MVGRHTTGSHMAFGQREEQGSTPEGNSSRWEAPSENISQVKRQDELSSFLVLIWSSCYFTSNHLAPFPGGKGMRRWGGGGEWFTLNVSWQHKRQSVVLLFFIAIPTPTSSVNSTFCYSILGKFNNIYYLKIMTSYSCKKFCKALSPPQGSSEWIRKLYCSHFRDRDTEFQENSVIGLPHDEEERTLDGESGSHSWSSTGWLYVLDHSPFWHQLSHLPFKGGK